ncbi:cinnamoyl-CoA reductase 1 [Sesamum indicum]|uniref:Dihydroflavonol 4-reductase n=1 Tax=Sesamum indicum TaxID=4182 RepID=A0A6I9TX11_SESIN|nr:cinnamoyl-CoA reductase 1 [Sesamum indicum]
MSGGGEVVCVTGASGYIASWLVKLLLHRGYTVKATARDLSDPAKVKHLKALEGAKERLQLFQANLVEEGSFDAAVDGCDGVFHTASPVVFDNINDPQVELIQPAVNGTLNVLRSCLKVPSIKRVVLTSSIAAVFSNRNAKTSDVVIDESSYSDPTFCKEIEVCIVMSKTLAEEAAWKFAEQYGIDLVVMNPGLVIGPCLQPTLSVSLKIFLDFITQGKCSCSIEGGCVLVDIRDVAYAHVLAFENASAKGRYCLVAETLTFSDTSNILRDLYPTLNLVKRLGQNQPTLKCFQVSKEKAKSLGINFIPMDQSFKDIVELLKERNLLV